MNEIIKNKLSTISTSPGVYIMKNEGGEVIYVGKAINLKNRVSTYFNNSKKHIKVQAMVSSVHDFDYIVCKSEFDALALENNLIKKFQPHYNILLKDSKTFPYLKINMQQDFPYFEITRRVEKDGAKYYGPYIGKFKAKTILEMLNFAFNLRECKQSINADKSVKSCLRKHLGYCLAPCENKCIKDEYLIQVKKAINFLNGNDNEIIDVLKSKMQKMIDEQNYEKAITYRDNISFLKDFHSGVITELGINDDIDAFAYSSNGQNVAISIAIIRNGKVLGVESQIFETISSNFFEEYVLQYYDSNKLPKLVLLTERITEDAVKFINDNHNQNSHFVVPQRGVKRKLLEMSQKNADQAFIKTMSQQELEKKRTIEAVFNLQNILSLPRPPIRMECYDISHTSGVFKVASMVVFINGKPLKSHYRKFKIKDVEGNNDFESLKEALKRRFLELNDPLNKDASFSSAPDLIIIDGGKGQLSSVMEIFNEYAKDFKNKISVVSLAKREEEIFVPNKSEPIIIAKNKMELQLFQRIRDEAHRFAITFHRKLRGKGMIKSFFDDIQGVGPKKKKNLVLAFQTLQDLENATFDEIAKVEGINQKLAEEIYNRLHS